MASTQLKAVDATTPEGTRVAVVDDHGVVHVTRTRSDVWRVQGDRLLVLVVGRSGGYLASRCFVLTEEALVLA